MHACMSTVSHVDACHTARQSLGTSHQTLLEYDDVKAEVGARGIATIVLEAA